MRIKALILFFPLLVFLIETASVLPAMQKACTIVAAEESECCMMNSSGQDEEQCAGETEKNKDDGSRDCTDNKDCSTCPVCYTFIFQPQYEWPAQQFLFNRHYGPLTTHYNSSFTASVWKPPNGFVA